MRKLPPLFEIFLQNQAEGRNRECPVAWGVAEGVLPKASAEKLPRPAHGAGSEHTALPLQLTLLLQCPYSRLLF